MVPEKNIPSSLSMKAATSSSQSHGLGGRMPGAQPLDREIAIPIEREGDIVRARETGRAMCRHLGFSEVGQTKVATAISELSRNIFQYAGRGEVRMWPSGGGAAIEVIAADRGPGIANLPAVLSPGYRSKRGMGLGLQGTRRIVDELDIDSRPGVGTTVRFRKRRG
ncbi:anti-sigma regulatory factor [Polyangium aurulentum]|uniref:anti-sigma regulatory factor n=1 Tax=Polyangium aurulentum TaxID=2567896 RepID=UPI00197D231B|nr:anti-sigma regulatory factor [Polyangium aurulentum]UQA59429.1 anti-sigma regulatory factor [Polyangium aurulentum]